MPKLTPRGPQANKPALLPALQTSRIEDPNTRQAIDALREWVEVRLGARGDFYERAVTQREYTPQVNDFEARIKALEVSVKKLVDASVSGTSDSNTANAQLQGVQDTLRSLQAQLSVLQAAAARTA